MPVWAGNIKVNLCTQNRRETPSYEDHHRTDPTGAAGGAADPLPQSKRPLGIADYGSHITRGLRNRISEGCRLPSAGPGLVLLRGCRWQELVLKYNACGSFTGKKVQKREGKKAWKKDHNPGNETHRSFVYISGTEMFEKTLKFTYSMRRIQS